MKRSLAGYVLLEALVGLLIFSLGLLGMIGFQATATRISTDSRFRTEAAMLADELIAKMAMSDVSKVETEFATSGTKYKDWLNNRVIGGSHLPNPVVTVIFSTANTKLTLLASVTIEWDLPDVSDSAKKREVHGRYATSAMLF